MNNTRKLKPYILVLSVFLVAILSTYWLKSNLGIGFSDKYSLSKYFPFNYLAPRKTILNPEPGIILDDSFDSFSLFGNWSSLWMREEGKVTKKLDSNGIDDSRCLVIKSSSTKSWSCSYKKMIRVREGDVFNYKASMKLQGDNLSAYAGVATFDADEEVISWNDFTEQVDRTNEWVAMKKTFTIPKGISYIRFRLSGAGTGEFRFDNIQLSILEKSPTPYTLTPLNLTPYTPENTANYPSQAHPAAISNTLKTTLTRCIFEDNIQICTK